MSIEMKNLSKSFDGKSVIENLSLCIEDGENIAIMGSSGCGKTTLLNILAGLLEPDGGEVIGLSEKRISFIFQEDRLAANFTVYRNIKLASEKGTSKKAIAENLEKTGLGKSLIGAKVSALSGGMKRRVSIIRAILADSDIVLADEPTKGLDEENRALVMNYILKNTSDKILIWVTHDEKEAEMVSSRIIYLKNAEKVNETVSEDI